MAEKMVNMVEKIRDTDLIQLYKMVIMAIITVLLGVTTFTLNRLVTKIDVTSQIANHNIISITELKKDTDNHDVRIIQLEICSQRTADQIIRLNKKVGL